MKMLYLVQLTQRVRASLFLLLMMLSMSGCGAHVYHIVQRGETLYSIGWAYGYDYRQVASWNKISPPYTLTPGQRLRVAPPVGQSAVPLQEYQAEETVEKESDSKPAPVIGPSESKISSNKESSGIKNEVRTVIAKVKHFIDSRVVDWHWPSSQHRILQTFDSNDPTRQGLDLSGKLGAPVTAAAAGRVVYAGSGLASYGKLIIVKHNDKYLSAYAYNQRLHVKEGDAVTAGQRIADMGKATDTKGVGHVMLHFEIRKNGKPVDPLHYLPRK
jgi:lipoprotein NlpD